MIDLIGWVVLAAIFMIVYLVSASVLRSFSMFGRTSQLVLGACVGGLSVVAIYRDFMSFDPRAPLRWSTPHDPRGLLIPYSALGITLLLLVLALLCLRIWRWFGCRVEDVWKLLRLNSKEKVGKKFEPRAGWRHSGGGHLRFLGFLESGPEDRKFGSRPSDELAERNVKAIGGDPIDDGFPGLEQPTLPGEPGPRKFGGPSQ